MNRWFTKPDWWMVILTTATFFVGIITLIVFYGQFGEMKTQTRVLTDQAKQAATDSIEAAKRVERQLATAKQQADAARDSVTAIHEEMREDQRAWVGRAIFNLTGSSITNFGKTPALDVIITGGAHFFDQMTPLTDKWIAEHKKELPLKRLSAGAIFPGQVVAQPLPIPVSITTNPNWPEVIKHQKFYYMFTKAVYYDGFGRKHTTRICGVWIPETNAFDPGYGCSKYNTAD
jgi:hypothetical protein